MNTIYLNRKTLAQYILPALLMLAIAFTGFSQTTFTTLTTGTTEKLLGVTFTNDSTGFACGENGVMLKTTDGGANWTQLTTGLSDMIWDVKAVPGTKGEILFAVGANGAIIKSSDAGATWTPKLSPLANGFLFNVQCLDSNNMFACGSNLNTLKSIVVRSTDGGETWINSSTTAPILDQIMFATDKIGYAVGNNTSFTDGGIWKTADGGFSWSLIHSTSKLIVAVWVIDLENVIAVGTDGQILTTDDGGLNWNSVSSNTTKALYDVIFKDSKHGYACGGDSSSNVILETSDGGNTWSTVSYSEAVELRCLSHAGEQLYVVGNKGHAAKATVGVNIEDITPKTGIKISPNPAYDQIIISAVIATHRPTTFIITDINGRTVMTSAITQKETTLNVSALPNGLYIYHIIGAVNTSGRLLKQ